MYFSIDLKEALSINPKNKPTFLCKFVPTVLQIACQMHMNAYQIIDRVVAYSKSF